MKQNIVLLTRKPRPEREEVNLLSKNNFIMTSFNCANVRTFKTNIDISSLEKVIELRAGNSIACVYACVFVCVRVCLCACLLLYCSKTKTTRDSKNFNKRMKGPKEWLTSVLSIGHVTLFLYSY